MASDTSADAAPEKKTEPKKLRRCAKCARPAADKEFKNKAGDATPYCSECRLRFPSLNAPHCVLMTKVAKYSSRRR